MTLVNNTMSLSNGRRLIALLAVGTTLLALLITGAQATPRASAAPMIKGTIAYSTGNSVRLIEADGSNDRLLWPSPYPADNGISSIEWNHGGDEIAFISDHESATSIYERDVYAIRPDGSGYRKLTNAPALADVAGYPTGTVTVDVQVTSGGGGPYLIYVSGAQAPQTVTAGTPGVWRLAFENVADFGATQQPVVAIEGQYRWLNAATADVQAGQSVHAGTLTISGSGFWHFGVHENKLTWRSDDSRLGFIFGAGCQMKQTLADPPPGMKDEPLIEPAVSGYTCLVDWAPEASRANQLLYTESNFQTGTGHIYLTEEGSTDPGEAIVNYPLPSTILDLEWMPDGSGFLFSYMNDLQTNANIYAYSWGASDVTPLTSFTGEFAARFSISPDGEHVVFERAASAEGNLDLWMMRSDGANLKLLVADAGRPAWGLISGSPPPPPPPPPGNEFSYLPFIRSH